MPYYYKIIFHFLAWKKHFILDMYDKNKNLRLQLKSVQETEWIVRGNVHTETISYRWLVHIELAVLEPEYDNF